MNSHTTDAAFEALCARLVAGESVREDEIPEQWRALPQVQRLLQFSRVLQGLAPSMVTDGTAVRQSENLDAPLQSTAQTATIGQWQLLRKLGSGGMGQVWLGARRDDTAHQVAIKRVHAASPSFATRLIIERQILARLSHPNIARFIDAGIHSDGTPWMAMEYVEGTTLSEWCDLSRPSLRQRLQMFLQICAAVDHAHRHLVVHRDLKPSNILVSPEGEPRLLDFGIAKLLDAADNEFTATALTPAYAAPEQLRGQAITTATDVYALGLLLFRLLAAALPSTREGSSLAQVLVHLDEEETQRPSQTAAGQQAILPYAARLLVGDLDAIVGKAMRAAPEARFASVAALAADVQRYLDGLPVLARAPTWRYRGARFVRRHRLAVGLSFLAFGALIAGAALALWQAELAQNAALLAQSEAKKARAAADTSQRVTGFTLKALSQLNPHGRDSTQIKSGAQLIEENVARAKQDLQDDPQAQAQILAKLAEIQSIVDTPVRAEETLRYALALAAAADNQGMQQDLDLRYTLATVLIQQKRYLEAEQELLQILPRYAQDADADRYLAMGYSNLALIARYTNRTDVAIERLAKAYDLATIAYGAQHPNTIELLSNRGILLLQSERLAEARSSFDRAISEFERYQGANFPRLASPLVQRATVLAQIGETGLARADCQRSMAIAAAGFDSADPQFIRYRIACAQTLMQIGDLQGAAALLLSSSAHAQAQPELEYRAAIGMAELHLLRHEFATALVHLVRAQAVQAAEPALAKEAPRLAALQRLLTADGDKSSNEALPEAIEACRDGPLFCAAQCLRLQQRGHSEAAFAAFDEAQRKLAQRQLNPVMFGAYQTLLARISSGDQQDAYAGRWLDMAQRNFAQATADSEWWRIYATTRAALSAP